MILFAYDLLLVTATLCLACVTVRADDAEDRRLDRDAFLEGLRQRGLSDLLQIHLRQAPSNDSVQTLLITRDLKLAEFTNPNAGDAVRYQALAEANRLLREALLAAPDDPRALTWKLELTRSLVFEEAEPSTLNTLYYGGTETDHSRVARIMDEALQVLDRLLQELSDELNRMDNLPLREFERLEKAGALETVENSLAQTQYIRRWAIYHRCRVRPLSDPLRREQLDAMLDELTHESDLLTVPHAESRHQCQSLLLAGMTARLIDRYPAALSHLNEALTVAGSQRDPQETSRLHWVFNLGRLERIRTLRDAGDYEGARKALVQFNAEIGDSGAEGVGLRLAAAFEASDLHRAEAQRFVSRGDSAQAQQLDAEIWKPLADLARKDQGSRDDVYAILFARIGKDADPARLHPFEQCALLAGLLTEASSESNRNAESVQSKAISPDTIDRAIHLGRQMWDVTAVSDSECHAEIGYNLGVALLQRGRRSEAAGQFLQVAEKYASSAFASQAAGAAVQIAAELDGQSASGKNEETRKSYLQALQLLVHRYPADERTDYWRFFLGQLLHELGRYEEAAAELLQVPASHEHYALSLYLRARCLAEDLKAHARRHRDDLPGIRARVTVVAEAAQRYRAASSSHTEVDSENGSLLSAQIALTLAESTIVPGVADPERSLQELEKFETRFPTQTHLLDRVRQVRLIALTMLNRWEKLQELLPAYMTSDAEDKGETLQHLIDLLKSFGSDIVFDRPPAASEMILLLSQRLFDWGMEAVPEKLSSFRLQLAEAHLEAGRIPEARRLFDECRQEDADRNPDGVSRDLRILHGLADSLYASGEYAPALRLFDRIFRESVDRDRTWWRSLLRNLECRTQLGHEPAGIVQSIQQHRLLDPKMGGEDLRKRFDDLEARNLTRASGSAK